MAIENIDNARSWIIAVLCSGVFFLTLGLFKIQGLLFVEMMHYFTINRKAASFTFFLTSIARSSSGPVAGYFGHKFGIYNVILCGFIICSIGILCSFFAINIFTIYFTWGIIVGIGLGFELSIVMQVINLHFKTHFSKAISLINVGGSLGGLVLSPIVEVLLSTYGMNGTILMLCGIILHGIPISLLLKVLSNKPSTNENLKYERARHAISAEHTAPHEVTTGIRHVSSESSKHGASESKNETNDNSVMPENSESKNLLKYNQTCTEHATDELKGHASTNNSDSVKICSESDSDSDCAAPMLNPDAADDGVRTKTNLDNDKNYEKANPFKVFFNISYLIIGLGFGCAVFLIALFVTVCVDLALDKGVTPSNATFLLMLMFITDTIGVLILGPIFDLRLMTRSNIAATAFFLSTISSLVFIWATEFIGLAIAIMMQSIAISSLLIASPGLVAQYVEKHQHTVAIASSTVFLAPFGIITPFLIGYFRDDLGSYDLLMTFSASVGFLNAILMLLLPCVENWRKTLV